MLASLSNPTQQEHLLPFGKKALGFSCHDDLGFFVIRHTVLALVPTWGWEFACVCGWTGLVEYLLVVRMARNDKQEGKCHILSSSLPDTSIH